jgi:hypothetical protein
MPRVLFIPVSGGEGSGEVERCRLLAHALRARMPDSRSLALETPALETHFLLAARAAGIPEATTRLPDSPTRAVPEVVAAIAALHPDVVVFDGNARVAALQAARAAGARTVLISSRPSARERGLRWRRMARLDEHWLVGADLLAAPGWRERLARSRYPGVAVRRYATLFAEPVDADAVLARLGVAPPYVVVCPGGGGHVVDGVPAHALFGAAAAPLARGGLRTLAVATRDAAPAIEAARLPNAELMALLSRAEAALLGGGSLLVQALALRVPVLALPLQAEQAARVEWLRRAGAVQVAESRDPATLAAQLRSLCESPDACDTLRHGIDTLGLRNGLDEAVAALHALL